jgi:hypothetical protein
MPETAQPAPETDEKRSRGLGSYVLWAFVAVMVYVLSWPPVYRLFPNSVLRLYIYRPLEWVRGDDLLRRPFAMYWRLWTYHPDKNQELERKKQK